MMKTRLLHIALGLLAALCALPAWTASYTLPGALPAGCSGSSGTYTCPATTLGNSDTVTIGNPKPATLNVNGNFDIARSVTNASGAASDLTVNVTGSLTVGNSGQINGSVTAASVTNPGGRANIGGSLTASGSISLGNSASVAQCVRSSGSATITLGNGSTVGGVCCGALGSCTSSCVVNNTGGAMPALCSGGSPPTLPGRFNAFETSTASNSVSGVIKTKVSGTAFSVAVVAINTPGTGVATTFTGNVKVEVLDASNNTGALNSSTNCRSSWAVASGTSSTTLSFASADLGRKNVSLTVAEAFRDARIRVSYPDTGTATVIGCSTDNFAIRPASFASFSVTDTSSSVAGTIRTLANGTATGGNVHKAGQPFTVRATAVNGSGATTALYTGTPAATLTACSGSACSTTLGTLTLATTATAGLINTSTASYSEAGAFDLQLTDTSFAAVDATDGSTAAERNISSSVLTVGRFVPDHFDLASLVTPVMRTFNSSTCASRSFTYLGQPFAYATRPQASITARNAAGATTVNYPNAKLSALTASQSFTPLVSATPGLDSSGTSLPSVTAVGSGTGTMLAQLTDTLTMVRSPTTPLAPFNASIALTWSVSDDSEAAVSGNGSIGTTTPLAYPAIAFDAGSEFRYGALKLGSAYGSELIALAVPLELQYWNGTSFVTNAADQCSTLATSSLSLANFRGGLAACETATSGSSVAFSSGRAVLRLLAPGNGNAGSTDGTLQLGSTITAGAVACTTIGASTVSATAANLSWLRSKLPGGTSYDQNPSARFSFGQYRSPLIQQREVY